MTVAIIQARMGSTRLPGKVLAPLAGKPLLQRVIERVQRAPGLRAVVATTDTRDDDAVAALCAQIGIDCFRGSEHDVLDRYYGAARAFGAATVARITADCPLLDPAVVLQVAESFAGGGYDYVANINPPSYPDGLDVELFSFETLESAWRLARLKSEREHVTLFIRNHPELFRIGNVVYSHDLSALRWTVDEPRDLVFAEAVYRYFGDVPFGLEDVVRLLKAHPELSAINSSIIRDAGLLKSLKEDEVVR